MTTWIIVGLFAYLFSVAVICFFIGKDEGFYDAAFSFVLFITVIPLMFVILMIPLYIIIFDDPLHLHLSELFKHH